MIFTSVIQLRTVLYNEGQRGDARIERSIFYVMNSIHKVMESYKVRNCEYCSVPMTFSGHRSDDGAEIYICANDDTHRQYIN